MQMTPNTLENPGEQAAAGPPIQTVALGLARQYLETLFRGWSSLGTQAFQAIRSLAGDLTIMQIFFLVGRFGIVGMNLFPWIVYNVDLMAPEVAGRGSSYRMFFLLPAPLGLLFYLIGGKYRLPVYYGALVIVGLLYLAGFLFPNPIHTDMQRPEDYRLHLSVFLYGGFLALVAATGWQALQTTLVSFDGAKAYLLEPRRPAEPLNPQLLETKRGFAAKNRRR